MLNKSLLIKNMLNESLLIKKRSPSSLSWMGWSLEPKYDSYLNFKNDFLIASKLTMLSNVSQLRHMLRFLNSKNKKIMMLSLLP